eukprot:gene3388-3878_t
MASKLFTRFPSVAITRQGINDFIRVSSRNATEGIIAQKGPFEVSLVARKRYAWCRCGHSAKQPFCDGQHRRKAPSISPLRFKAETTGIVRICGCKQTTKPPYCDETHQCDAVQNA